MCGRMHCQLLPLACLFVLTATAASCFPHAVDVNRHKLQSVAAGGWRSARATFDDPSSAFQQNFTSRHFSDPYNGNCGLWDGINKTDTTAALVPASMRASLGESAAVYPGSCGRCYEVRCMSGIIPSNASGIPLMLQAAEPPYGWDHTGSAPLVDDYGRLFPGNTLANSSELFTQCWNATDQPAGQDLLNNNSATVVQIIGSGICQGANGSLCTDLTEFVLNYDAFEKLAHPGYGHMNLQFRPVDCDTGSELAYEPGFINTTIYSDHMEAGWGFHPYIAGQAYAQASVLEYEGSGIDGTNATCVTLASGGNLYFNCPDCDAPGYQPFLLSNTSGLSFWVTGTSTLSNGTLAPTKGWPNLTVMLGNNDMSQTCNATINLQDPAYASYVKNIYNHGLLQRTILLQNEFHDCIPQMGNMTSIGFQAAPGVGPVSFCLDQIQLLPSTMQGHFASTDPRSSMEVWLKQVLNKVAAAGLLDFTKSDEISKANPVPTLANCYLAQPLPVNQFGAYLTGAGFPGAQNVTAADPAASYLLYQFIDMQMYADLHPVLGTCFSQTAQLNQDQSQVNQCAGATGYCCYNFTTNPLNTSKPDFLAGVCNAMSTNGSVCQAFNFQADTNIGWFKGQAAGRQLDLSKTCLSPNITSWILNAAIPPGLTDARAVTTAIVGSGSHPYCSNIPNTLFDYNTRQAVTAATAKNDGIMTPAIAHNVTGNTTDLGYTVLPHTDMDSLYDLQTASSASCFNVTPTGNLTAVDTCHLTKKQICCIGTTDLRGNVDSTLPDTLAQICNNILFQSTTPPYGPTVCQGFAYDSYQQVAFFKGQAPNQTINQDHFCYGPNSTLWLLNAALNASSKGDTRVQPGFSTSSTSNPKKHAFHWSAVYGVLAAVLTPAIPVTAWLVVTFSYRQDKLMIIRQVGKYVSEADLGNGAADDAVGSRQGITISRSASSQASSRGSGDALMNDQLLNGWAMPVAAAPVVQDTARKIAVRSLRRWDAFLGFRAGHDGLGRTLGVWKDKFDGVRCAVLLLAMRKLNQQIKIRQGGSGSLMEVWQSSNWTQQNALLEQLARTMQNISEQEAQDLPNKDPDVPGLHDKLYGMAMICCRR